MHQIADQVGNLNPGQYITPRLMFPAHTLPGVCGHGTLLYWANFGVLSEDWEIFSLPFLAS